MFSHLSKQTSSNRMETYLFKMQQELEKNTTRELKEAAVKFKSECCIAAPLGSTNGSTTTQDLFWLNIL